MEWTHHFDCDQFVMDSQKHEQSYILKWVVDLKKHTMFKAKNILATKIRNATVSKDLREWFTVHLHYLNKISDCAT